MPKEIESLKNKNILRVSLSGWSNALLDFLNDALILGCKFLEELSIHFAINTDETPFHPTGDHANYLNYFNSFLPDKYINDEENIINEPMKICYTDKFDQILMTIQKNVKYATNLKILAFYAPPMINEDIMFHLPETIKAFIIHSCSNLKIDSIPDVELISLKNCYLNDENCGFILDSLKQYQETHNKQLKKFMLKVFGPCARHTPEEEIQKYFSDRDKLLIKYQASDEDVKCIQYLDLSFNNLNYRFLDQFGELLQKDEFLQYIDLNNNQFGHFVQRISLDTPTQPENAGKRPGSRSGAELKNSGAKVNQSKPTSAQILSGGINMVKYANAIKPSALHSLKVTQETLESYKSFLLSGFTPNFYRVPTAETIKFLSRYCETATETSELTALRTHPLVIALERNPNIFMLALAGTVSCLQRFIQVRVMYNRKQLLEALQNCGNGQTGVLAGPSELLKCDFQDVETWQAQHKDLRLLFYKFDAKMARNHAGCGCAATQAAKNQLVQNLALQASSSIAQSRKEQASSSGGSAAPSKASSLRTAASHGDEAERVQPPQKRFDARKLGSGLQSGKKAKQVNKSAKSSLHSSKQSSAAFRSRREDERDLQLLTKREKKVALLLSGKKEEKKKRAMKQQKIQKPPRMKRVPSGSDLNGTDDNSLSRAQTSAKVSYYAENQTPFSQLNQGTMQVKYQNDEPHTQIVNTGINSQQKAGTYVNARDFKDNATTNTQFTINQQQSLAHQTQSITASQLSHANHSAADFNKLMDQVVDDTFDTILFLSSNDKMRAKNVFSENQEKINNFCQLVVSDLSAGRIQKENIKGVLFDYIQNLVK